MPKGTIQRNRAANGFELCLPSRLDTGEHSATSDLVDLHKHLFSGLPPGRAVLDEVVSELVEHVQDGCMHKRRSIPAEATGRLRS